MRKYLIGAVAGAIAATSLGAFAAQSWVGVPPLLQQLLNTRAGGDMAYGTDTDIDTDGTGNDTIAHGLGCTPTFAAVNIVGDTATVGVEVQAVDGTSITTRVFTEADGADATTDNHTVAWMAKCAA